jgi:hypothetical protein
MRDKNIPEYDRKQAGKKLLELLLTAEEYQTTYKNELNKMLAAPPDPYSIGSTITIRPDRGEGYATIWAYDPNTGNDVEAWASDVYNTTIRDAQWLPDRGWMFQPESTKNDSVSQDWWYSFDDIKLKDSLPNQDIFYIDPDNTPKKFAGATWGYNANQWVLDGKNTDLSPMKSSAG